jgi:hypothetical protein
MSVAVSEMLPLAAGVNPVTAMMQAHTDRGSKRNVVFTSRVFSESLTAVGAVVTVGKPQRFLRRLFQAARGNHQERIAEGLLCRFPQLRQFPQRVPPGVFLPPGCGKALENSHPAHRPCRRSSLVDDSGAQILAAYPVLTLPTSNYKEKCPRQPPGAWTRVINQLCLGAFNDSRSEEEPSIGCPLRDCKK